MVRELFRQYENNPKQFTDRQAEQIARLAQRYGIRFPRESKAIRKGVFDLVDTALLGMVPNKWRPVSRGERTFGETKSDKLAGTIGSGLGMLGLGAGAIAKRALIGRGIGQGIGYGTQAGGYAMTKGAEYAGKANAYARQIIRNAPDYATRAGIKSGQIKARYAQAKAGNLTSLDRGNSTRWFSNLRDRFRAGENLANPMGTYNPNLLLLTEGSGIPLAGGRGVML